MSTFKIREDLLSIPAETLETILQQMVMFIDMFIEKFEFIFTYKADIASGRFRPPKLNNMAIILNLIFMNVFPIRLPIGSAISSLYTRRFRGKEADLVSLFPNNIKTIRCDVYTFAFTVFRCYESILANANLRGDCQRNAKIIELYNKIIKLMVERIMFYFQTNAEEIRQNETAVYGDHFLDAFFPLAKIYFMSTNTFKMCNKIGIVLLDDATGRKNYFAQVRYSEETEHYRLLNHKELQAFEECKADGDVERLESILHTEYVQKINITDDCEFILQQFTLQDFNSVYSEHGSTENASLQSFELPNRINIFVQRIKASHDIKKALTEGRIVVMTGIKGCGKTELAIDIGNDLNKTHNVFWVNCSSLACLEQSFSQIYTDIFEKNVEDTCEVEELVGNVYKKYKYEPCLIIFDNAEGIDNIWKYFPKQSRENQWKILITSCRKNWLRERQNLKCIHLEIMTNSESVELFKNYIDYFLERYDFEERCSSIKDNSDPLLSGIRKLIELAPKYPLTIRQLAAYVFDKFKTKRYINNDWKTIFCEEINVLLNSQTNHKTILKYKDKQNPEYDKSVFKATLQSIKRLKLQAIKPEKENDKIVARVALDVLNMLSYFAPTNVPIEVFRPYCEENSTKKSTDNLLGKVVDLLVEDLIIKRSDNFTNVEELFQIVNRINLSRKGSEVVSAVLTEALKTIKIYVEKDEKYLNNVLQHIDYIWRFASTDRQIVNEFIMKSANNRLGKTTFFHVLVQYSEVSVLENILNIAKGLNAKYTKEILVKKNSLQHTPLYCAIESGRKETAYLLVKSINNCEEFVILNQAVMFMCMFVERFEYLFSKKQISKSKIVADEKAGDYFLNKFLLSWMLWINVPKGSFSKSHCTEYFKKKVRKVREMFPKKIVRIRHELFAIAFEVFRSYESLLSVSLIKINSSEVNLEKRFDCFIDVIVDKILTYFELHPFESDGYLLSYFYKACFSPSLCHMICSDELLKMNQVGIVLLDEDSQKKTYFNQIDFQDKTDKYRILNNKEKKYFNQYETKDPRFKLKQIIGVDFVNEQSIAGYKKHKYFLDKYRLKDFLVLFKDQITFLNSKSKHENDVLDVVKNIMELE